MCHEVIRAARPPAASSSDSANSLPTNVTCGGEAGAPRDEKSKREWPRAHALKTSGVAVPHHGDVRYHSNKADEIHSESNATKCTRQTSPLQKCETVPEEEVQKGTHHAQDSHAKPTSNIILTPPHGAS